LNNFASALTRPIVGAPGQLYSIDILRGLAAVAILVFHYTHFTMGNGSIGLPESSLAEVSFYQSLGYIRTHGALAVMLFWMISGFVFMHVYAGKPVTGWTFFVNRFARLYPLHLLTLLVVAVIQWTSMGTFGHYLIYQINDGWHFFLNLFFASEWGFSKGNSFNGPIWSVSVEILIYILFWIYLRTGWASLLSSLLVIVGFLVAFIFAKKALVLCGIYFFAGSSLYAAYVMIPVERYRTALVASLIVFAGWGLGWISGALSPMPITILLIGLFAPLLLALALSERMGLHGRYKRFRAIGNLTYSTYLWHSPLQMLFLLGAAAGFWPVAVVLTNAFFIAYLTFVCAVGYLSFKYIERPAQDALRRQMLTTTKPLKAISAP